MADLRAIESLSELQTFADYLLSSDLPIGWDTETGYSGPTRNAGSLRVYEPTHLLVGMALTNSKDFARYVPLNHDFGPNVPIAEALEILKPVFETRTIIAHNFLFDLRVLQRVGDSGVGPKISIPNFDDTLLMSYVLGKTPLHGLKYLTKHYFDYEQASLKSLFPDQESWTYTAAKKLRFNELPVTSEVVSYVLDDGRFTLALHDKFVEEFNKPENRRLQFMYKVEKEILLILADMQNQGVAFDWDLFDRDWAKGRRLADYMVSEVRQRFLKELGQEDFKDVVNFNSATQMRKLLYEDLGLTTARVTKSGALSTDQTTLQGLAPLSPGAAKLAEYKKYVKNLGFFETWDAYRDSVDGRIHSNLSQTMIQAGRFASNDPNIQNVKKEFWFQVSDTPREELVVNGKNGRDYWHGSQRDYIVSSPGYTLLAMDVSQGELRTIAGLANEPYLNNAFADGQDIHKATAALMFHVPYDQVTKEQRQRAKGINFALLYQQGPKALGEGLNVTYEEAEELMAQYFSSFGSVGRWIDGQKKMAHNIGYVETFLGRRITLWDMKKSIEAATDKAAKGFIAKAERLAVNSPVQGGLADIMKLGMIRSTRALKKKGWWGDKVRLLMNQHDSLVYEVHHDLQLEDVYDTLLPAVEFNPSGQYQITDPYGKVRVQEIRFPDFLTDWEYGDRWGTGMKEFKR